MRANVYKISSYKAQVPPSDDFSHNRNGTLWRRVVGRLV